MSRAIPGPRGFFENARAFREFSRMPPRYVREAQDRWGDVVELKGLRRSLVLVGDPALAGELLQDKDGAFQKDWVTRGLKLLLGQGLLTSEGELWRKQRKLIAPSLSKKHIAAYADAMVRKTREWLARVEPGRVRDVHRDMTEVTLEIVVETLFGTSLGAGGHEDVGRALDQVMVDFQEIVQTWRQFFPEWVPFAARRRTVRAGKEIDRAVFDVIRRRRASGALGDDLLSRLLEARDEAGSGMTDEQLRDEAITLFLAGHETTANALSFTLLLLAEHPEVDRTLFEEVERVLGDRPATAEDVGRLPYTDAVLRESMRVRPPAHIFGREAVRDTKLGPWDVPKGTTLLVSPWALHHDARFFPDPFAFRTERWLDGSTANLPKNAYLPFGGGPRICIGDHFAMMESVLVLATIARRLRFEKTSDEPVELQAAVTLRPKGALRLRPVRRA
jgi:cytochrome P450